MGLWDCETSGLWDSYINTYSIKLDFETAGLRDYGTVGQLYKYMFDKT